MDQSYKELERQLLETRELVSKQKKELAVLDIAYAAVESANTELRAELNAILGRASSAFLRKRESGERSEVGYVVMIDSDDMERLRMMIKRNDGGQYLKDAQRLDHLELDAKSQFSAGADEAVLAINVKSGQTVRQALDASNEEDFKG